MTLRADHNARADRSEACIASLGEARLALAPTRLLRTLESRLMLDAAAAATADIAVVDVPGMPEGGIDGPPDVTDSGPLDDGHSPTGSGDWLADLGIDGLPYEPVEGDWFEPHWLTSGDGLEDPGLAVLGPGDLGDGDPGDLEDLGPIDPEMLATVLDEAVQFEKTHYIDLANSRGEPEMIICERPEDLLDMWAPIDAREPASEPAVSTAFGASSGDVALGDDTPPAEPTADSEEMLVPVGSAAPDIAPVVQTADGPPLFVPIATGGPGSASVHAYGDSEDLLASRLWRSALPQDEAHV